MSALRLVQPVPTCGKHGCLEQPEHDGPHRNRWWRWTEGKEGSSAIKVSTQEGK